MIYVQTARETFNRKEIYNIGWIERYHNVVDALTNPLPCPAMLSRLRDHRLEEKTLQFLLRDATPD